MDDDVIKVLDESESTQDQDEADEDAVTSSGLSETPKKKKKKLKKQVKEVDVQRVTVSTYFRLEFFRLIAKVFLQNVITRVRNAIDYTYDTENEEWCELTLQVRNEFSCTLLKCACTYNTLAGLYLDGFLGKEA